MTSAFGISNSRMGHHDYGLSGSGQRGPMPPIRANLEFFGNLSSVNTSVVSGAVAQLGDDSGNGRHFTQATGTKRPTYSASDANFGGRPSMTFDGVQMNLAGPAFAASANATATIYVVFRSGTAAALLAIVDQQIAGIASSVAVYSNLTAPVVSSYFANPGGTYTTKIRTIAASTVYRSASVIDGSTGSASIPGHYLNGVVGGSYSTTLASNTAALANAIWGIGSNPAGNAQFFDGRIADILIYSSAHSATQVAQVDAWLKWRNGL